MTDEEIAKLAKQRVEERTGFWLHGAMYLLVNAGLFIIWMLTGSEYPWFVWPLLGWGVGLFAHALTFWFGPSSRRGEEAVAREVQRLRALQQRG